MVEGTGTYCRPLKTHVSDVYLGCLTQGEGNEVHNNPDSLTERGNELPLGLLVLRG